MGKSIRILQLPLLPESKVPTFTTLSSVYRTQKNGFFFLVRLVKEFGQFLNLFICSLTPGYSSGVQ